MFEGTVAAPEAAPFAIIGMAIIIIGIATMVWLTFSKGKLGFKFRQWRDADGQIPHVHTIDGYTFAHSHPNGHKEHTHATIPDRELARW
jgi:hypothetical protein